MAAITDLAMRAKPTDKEQWLTQPFARGAGVFLGRITPKGERLFYFRYSDSQGRRPFLPIGSFHPRGEAGGLTVGQAYQRAAEFSRLYQSGAKDLREHLAAEASALDASRRAAENQAQADELVRSRRLTVRQLFERWRDTDLQPRTLADGTREGRKDGGAWVQAQFERHVFQAIGTRVVADLGRADLLAILDARKAAGTLRTANVLFSDLRQMLAFAVDREIIANNPLEGLKRRRVGGKDTERERVLTEVEIQALWAALPAARMQPRAVHALWLILATGVRAGEAMGAVWSADAKQGQIEALRAAAEAADTKFGLVDLAAGTWHIPDTKNQRPHTIHLSEFAAAQFKALAMLRELGEDGKPVPWVFPDRSRAQPVCVKSLGKQIADRQRPAEARMSGRSKNTEALALPGGAWTLHDLRRTTGTLMAGLGISGDVIDECLNHKIESRVRRVYIRDRREADQARAFDALGALLARLTTRGQDAANVLTFNPRAA